MKKAIVLVFFGTANLEGFNQIETFEKEIRDKFKKEYCVCKAFTSKILANMISKKHNKKVLVLEEILEELNNKGYKNIHIQPVYIKEGNKYINTKKIVKKYEHYFINITFGKPLITNNKYELKDSCNMITDIIKKEFYKYQNIVLVWHGSRNEDLQIYNILKDILINEEYKSLYIGTLEGEINKEDVIEELIKNNIENVILVPLFLIKGNHIKKDIFGESNSWKSAIEEKNIKVIKFNKTLLEYKEIKEWYINEISINL